jgi:hypothetical protein
MQQYSPVCEAAIGEDKTILKITCLHVGTHRELLTHGWRDVVHRLVRVAVHCADRETKLGLVLSQHNAGALYAPLLNVTHCFLQEPLFLGEITSKKAS